MKLPARLILMITSVVAAIDLIEYYHLRQHPEHLTPPFGILIVVVTVAPIAVITWVWQRRELL